MTCSERDALLHAFRAAMTRFRSLVDIMADDKELDESHSDCEQSRRALRLHREEHGC